MLYGFMGAFGPLALIAVSLRLYTRIRFAKVGADDVAIVIGFVRAPEFRGYDKRLTFPSDSVYRTCRCNCLWCVSWLCFDPFGPKCKKTESSQQPSTSAWASTSGTFDERRSKACKRQDKANLLLSIDVC